MMVSVDRQRLADALAAVCTVTPTRTPKPILQCMRLEALTDVLLVSATDMELSLRYALPNVEIQKPGDIVVKADVVAQIVRECSDEILKFETTKNHLVIKGTGSHFEIVTQASSDFPPVPKMDEAADFSVPVGELKEMIEWTQFAAAREASRYAINGILWELAGDRLTLVATDGRRMSMATGRVAPLSKNDLPAVIVPTRAMSLISRLATDDDAEVLVRVTKNQIMLRLGAAVVSSALVEGHFPDYRKVIPTENNRLVELNVLEFQGALKRAALLTNEESRAVRFSLSRDRIQLSSRAPEQGEATITVPVEYAGESLDVGFNPVFLLDALRVAQGDRITLALKESSKPGLITSGERFQYVVMPVSLPA